MGTTTSKQDDSGSSNVKNDNDSSDSKASTEEQSKHTVDEQVQKEPVIEDEIVPTESIQVRSFLAAPGVSKSLLNLKKYFHLIAMEFFVVLLFRFARLVIKWMQKENVVKFIELF